MTSFRGVRRRTIPFLMATAVAPMAIVTIAPADRQWHGRADVAGAGQFQPAALAADTHAEPDAGSGHRAVADPYGVPAADADTAREPTCHADADAARHSDPDAAGDRIAYTGRHAGSDSDANPDADGDSHSIAHAGRGRYAVARGHDRTGDRTG